MFYFDNTKGWEVVDIAGNVASGLWHDDFRKAIVGVLVGREDFFAGNGVGDGKGKDGVFVNVAVVVDKSTNGDWRGGREFRDIVFDNRAFVSGFTSDIGIDDATNSKDIVNANTFR